MSEAVKRPVITPTDRLGLTACLAIICHAIIVLGVTFAQEDKNQNRYNTMDIVLVQQRSKNTSDAKLLAQASLEGGGNTEEEVAPSTPVPPPFPDNTPEVAAPPAASQPQAPQQAVEELRAEQIPATSSATEQIAVLSESAKQNKASPDKTAESASEKPDVRKQTEQKAIKAKAKPSATSLLTTSMKIAALSARVDQNLLAKASRPKRKFISASTREYKYAAYMDAWRSKVERVGNLNYPEEARKRKLSGSLVLDVALKPDGSISAITVRQPSGHKVLDDAAIRIVKLAAPFAPFPDAIQGETDILHIIRTWQFLKKGGFR
ncbi:MAG: TonB family protein [Gammaproteobacteria bacterium]|nr:TonB family protein [Gammaproteobacteria bacterium]